MKEVKRFNSTSALISDLENRVAFAKEKGIKGVFVNTVDFRNIDKDALIAFFGQKQQMVDLRRCHRGFYDITIIWRNN